MIGQPRQGCCYCSIYDVSWDFNPEGVALYLWLFWNFSLFPLTIASGHVPSSRKTSVIEEVWARARVLRTVCIKKMNKLLKLKQANSQQPTAKSQIKEVWVWVLSKRNIQPPTAKSYIQLPRKFSSCFSCPAHRTPAAHTGLRTQPGGDLKELLEIFKRMFSMWTWTSCTKTVTKSIANRRQPGTSQESVSLRKTPIKMIQLYTKFT